jgi:hypothetical protein
MRIVVCGARVSIALGRGKQSVHLTERQGPVGQTTNVTIQQRCGVAQQGCMRGRKQPGPWGQATDTDSTQQLRGGQARNYHQVQRQLSGRKHHSAFVGVHKNPPKLRTSTKTFENNYK